MARDIVESSILKLCTYEDCVYPKSPKIIDQLLPSEVATSLVLEVSMVELTTTVELSPSHNLHVRNKLSLSQLKLLTKLLNQHENPFLGIIRIWWD